ncbi:MAG: hypothetical protein GXO60_02610 [Epsilonproteobacteria bacterium]|nr:hypothetical protein [Campylobacterota bacterium]
MRSFIYIILVIFLSTGCSRVVDKYRVKVDAIASQEANNAIVKPITYVIEPLSEDSDVDALRFQRQSRILENILEKKGYQKVKYKNLAQQIIYFDYGIETVKNEIRTYSEPDISFGVSWGFPYRRYYHRSPFWSDFGYTRYITYTKAYKLFNRYIVILAKDQLGNELWRVDVSSVGESDNLAKIVPILLKASEPYIGKDTNEPIELVIEDDKKE